MATLDDYNANLPRLQANHQPLTPLTLLDRAARVFPDHPAIVHGEQEISYSALYERSRRLASALAAMGVQRGQTVSALLLNTPPMIEAHYGVPMTGAVLNALNTRLDAAGTAFILQHCEAKVLLVDAELLELARAACADLTNPPALIVYHDPTISTQPCEYEELLATGDPHYAWLTPHDEWDAISLNYTSGTTGDPKGVVYHHRGAMLLATGNIVHAGMAKHPVYLWTLPMFHCNGWCFPWSLSAVAGTHVCLRQVRAKAMFDAIADHGVTHMCGAPVVMSALLDADPQDRRDMPARVAFFTAAAPPPENILAAMGQAGFDVTHLYGLTEVYGPAVINEWNRDWDALESGEQARLKARQGVRYAALEELDVLDANDMPVPADGQTMGEVVMRGNVVMKGYFRNPTATADAFRRGWFRSGDLGVKHPDGYIQLKDRSKDIIISGGENISSIEVEEALYRHPAVATCAVVARPDAKWGETPCAFIELRPNAQVSAQEIIAHCRAELAHFKAPRHVIFTQLPKTSTGKVQKFELRKQAEQL